MQNQGTYSEAESRIFEAAVVVRDDILLHVNEQ